MGAGSLTEISKRIARRLGRSPETVRYTIKNFDREHPEQALFPSVNGTFDPTTKLLIFNSFRRGVPVETLAKRFSRTRSSMYRVLNEIRAQRLMEQRIDYIYHDSFDSADQEVAIMADMPGVEEYRENRNQLRVPKDAPPELASLYETPLLNKEQEQHLFRKMNFLKHRANRILKAMLTPSGRIDPHKLRTQDLDKADHLFEPGQRYQGPAHQLQHAVGGLHSQTARRPDR